ncbi:hypothetical protein OsI_30900 [Oryza sativa Indica Group]|uniref:Uncharacterized protein n=1 Tax=Oryza sativa subsp. indica TaxID=39946 RepID=A2YZW5_ORYSI|nr:hypothetical protein OsI_30900 [Oryza sativa Indica Group]
MDKAIEEVMAEAMNSMNVKATEQAVAEAGAEAEANTVVGLDAEVLEMVAEAKALETMAEAEALDTTVEGDMVTIVSRPSGYPKATTSEEASLEKHGA